MRGSLFKKYKSSWTIVLSLGRDPVTHKYRQRWVSVKGNRKAAEKKLVELLYQVDGGANLNPSQVSLGDYLKMWLRDLKSTVSPRTFDRYAGIIENHIIPELGKIPLDSLRPENLKRHYKRLLERGLCARTVNYHHILLHHALKDAIKPGLITQNVCEAVTPPGYKEVEMQTWNEEELNQFLQFNRKHYLYALFYLALFTGMRRSELLGLQWHDIDFENRQISIRRALHRVRDGSYIFTQPKTERSRRTIALSNSTLAVLREYRQATQDTQGNGSSSQQVFHNGEAYHNPNTVTWQWKKACIAAGVRPIRLHDARHTHASLMLKQGVHPKIVSERLGHSSIAITLDTYSHVLPGLQEAAAQGFDALLTVHS